MKTLSRFVAKFTSLIVAVLSCFDRVLFKGQEAKRGTRPKGGHSGGQKGDIEAKRGT
jgi:hypothetical protein